MTALLMGIDALPFLVVSPVGGVIADAWDRRKLMVVVSSYQASVTAIFAGLLALDMVGMPLLFGYVLAMGVSWALWEPVRTAVIPTTVPKRSLVNAFALNILAFNGSRLVMPTAAGVVLAAAGPVPVLASGSVLYLLSAAAATRISPLQGTAGDGPRRGPASQLAEAALFISREPVLVGLMLIVVTMVLLLMPVMNGLMPGVRRRGLRRRAERAGPADDFAGRGHGLGGCRRSLHPDSAQQGGRDQWRRWAWWWSR